jgi:hypothetical protein
MARGGVAVSIGEAKPSYPPGAALKLPVRATPSQKCAWEVAARNHGLATPGAFLAYAGDLYLALRRAYLEANDAHYDALHPAGLAETEQRREERAKRREGER